MMQPPLTIEQIEASRIIKALYCRRHACPICAEYGDKCKGRNH